MTLKYIDKTSRGSATEQFKMDHPLKVSESLIRTQLSALRFEELSLMGKKKFIFQPEEVAEISGLIARGIRNLKPNNILFFDWEGPQGGTSADVFVVDRNLHWRFISIHGMPYSNSNLNRWGSSTWRLSPVKGQVYLVTDKLLGDKVNENWIVSPLKLIDSKRRVMRKSKSPASKTPATSSSGNKGALEKKLKFLKDLRQKDLIDEEEYQRKRKELLDTLL